MSADGSASGCACCEAGGYAATTDWPSDVSRRLFEHLERLGFEGHSVLEIGCGYGRLVVGALLGGASSATGVELDPEALEEAADRAVEAGVGGRARFLPGDGAELELPAHDLVVLDRTICCYPDGDLLVGRSLAVARQTYAISVPESRGLRGAWNRLVYGLVDAWDRLRRNPDHVYLHDVRRMEDRIAGAGFQLAVWERLDKWYLAVYVRPAS